jgi:hypothetical protein
MALTTKQKRFAKNIAGGMTAADAARAAGYAKENENSLCVGAARLLRHPEIQREAFALREARLTGPLARKALACLESVLDDQTAPPAARVQAARFVLEAAGHGIENRRLLARSGDGDEKPLHQLSLQALEVLAHAAELQVREARGTIIEVEEFCTPGTPP